MNYNKIMVGGHLASDLKERMTNQGQLIVAGTIATDYGYGEKREAVFIDFVMFGDRAKPLTAYCKKGSNVFLEGKLRQNKWEQDGQTRTKLELIVDDYRFIGKRADQEGQQAANEIADAFKQPKVSQKQASAEDKQKAEEFMTELMANAKRPKPTEENTEPIEIPF